MIPLPLSNAIMTVICLAQAITGFLMVRRVYQRKNANRATYLFGAVCLVFFAVMGYQLYWLATHAPG